MQNYKYIKTHTKTHTLHKRDECLCVNTCVCKTKTDKSELGQGKGREGKGREMFEFSVDDDTCLC